MLNVVMGNAASACVTALANAVIEKLPHRPCGRHTVQVKLVVTELGHGFDHPTDSIAPTGDTSTFGKANSKDAIQNMRERTHSAVHPVPSEPDLIGHRACDPAEPPSTSAAVNLHAVTNYLKKESVFGVDSVYELVREDYPDVEFVYFHGLQPDPEDTVHAFWRTWKMRFNEECWLRSLLPKLLNYTDREIRPRVLSVSYEKSSKRGLRSWMASPIDQFNTSEQLMMDLIVNGRRAVGQKHNIPVILVGHDLGGIMIKHFLMKVKETLAAGMKGNNLNLKYFWESLSGLVFFATPQVGYPTIDAKIPPNSSSPSLQFLKALNKDAARVNKEFANFRKFKNPKYEIPTLRIWGQETTDQECNHNELVVPRHVRSTNDNDYTALEEDHFQICQPTGLHSLTALRFASFVVNLIEELREDEHFV